MTVIASPLGWRLLSARLDLRDTLAEPRRASANDEARHRGVRAQVRLHPLAVHRRADDTAVGRITVWRDARGLAGVRLEPDSFADGGYAAEALDTLLAVLPTRRRAIAIEGGSHARRFPPRAHFAHGVDATAAAHATLGIDADYARMRGLAPVHEPRRLVLLGPDLAKRPLWLHPQTAQAFRRLRRAAAADGVAIVPVSGFRSVGYQVALIRRKLARGDTLAHALTVLAAPGFSEHHSGRAMDLGSPGSPPAEEAFETTPAFAWLSQHALAHGFRLSYPRGNPHGIAYEPWHWYHAG